MRAAFLLVLVLVGCTMHTETDTRRFVTATYEVPVDRQSEFLALLKKCEQQMRQEGLITSRPAIRMQSKAEPQLILEIFEWADDGAFERAQQTPAVLEYWGKYERLWTSGGFGMSRFPETNENWAQYPTLD